MTVIGSEYPDKITEVLSRIENGFTPLSLLGCGSLGVVYECAGSDNLHYAVKLIEESPMTDPAVPETIIEAARATMDIPDSVRVVRVFSSGRQASFCYIVMEMMDGGTLEKIVADLTFNFEMKLQIAVEIAETLDQIHKLGIIHGDLKPANVLMTADNKPYLNDFYMCSAREQIEMPLMPLGTPYYMSPEQARGAMITPVSDIYSYGVMIYELLTGEMPYASGEGNVHRMLHMINDAKLIPPGKVCNNMTYKLEAILLKMLAKLPDQRYRNMGMVAKDLSAYLDGNPISVPHKQTLQGKFLHWLKPSRGAKQ